jgi:hypothetical protein
MLYQEISSGARSALPMGVAPEAILEKDFFEYRLKIYCNPSYFNSKYFNFEIL